jgi:hypothetical protein
VAVVVVVVVLGGGARWMEGKGKGVYVCINRDYRRNTK